MKKKIIGIFICMLLITTCGIPVYGRLIEGGVKTSLYPTVSLYNDYIETPLYKRSLQDIISGKQLPSLTGTRPLLVILTNFINKDMDSSHDVDYFTDMMWGHRPCLSDYFSEVSYGKFTYSQAGVLGWYKTDFTQSQMESNPLQFFTEVMAAADEDFNSTMRYNQKTTKDVVNYLQSEKYDDTYVTPETKLKQLAERAVKGEISLEVWQQLRADLQLGHPENKKKTDLVGYG